MCRLSSPLLVAYPHNTYLSYMVEALTQHHMPFYMVNLPVIIICISNKSTPQCAVVIFFTYLQNYLPHVSG